MKDTATQTNDSIKTHHLFPTTQNNAEPTGGVNFKEFARARGQRAKTPSPSIESHSNQTTRVADNWTPKGMSAQVR